MAGSAGAFVAFREATYTLPGGRTILDRLSLEVGEGETLALLGRSGSGKTTALRLVNALLAPTAGYGPGRRPRHERVGSDPAPAADRLRDPGGRIVPAPHGRRERRGRARARRAGPPSGSRRASTSCSSSSGFPPASSRRDDHTSCRAGSGSASASRGPSPRIRRSYSSTSRSAPSIRSPAARSSASSAPSPAASARRRSS